MRRLYENKDEETFHQRAIEGLAQETAQSIAGVKAVYEVRFIKLKSDAKITAYLALLARRRARETLRRKQV